jgi:RNA polymerase sigma factor (sigma-70 family)
MQVNQYSSAEILQRLKKGDRDVLVELYKANETMILKYIKEQNGSTEDAEDLLQEALVVLWNNSKKSDFELTAKPSTYIYAIVKNLWLKNIEKSKRTSPENHISQNAVADVPDADKQMDFALVRKMLNQMGETCRQVLLMFYYEGLDMQTIAKANNFANADVAKAKKHQCLKELEKNVKSQYHSTDFFR